MDTVLIQKIDKLNRQEKLVLMEVLWNSIASEPDGVPLPDHHTSVLDERLKTLDEDFEKGESWDVFIKKYI
ncbi:putative addiction module component, TIGR02574 family [Cyclonatronum proteinivorum]|uniref:Putative addiction module component, TIGR02574 family n=1 Tax=Cyclonatronum proteinivorum TaxID=1457365 RepID=A0A345UM84_9BACT|nr:addiction module protein [Cyclonatronum proteinivorum]AXJ01586.1 putative addiction module component, TIGR02574 family [Cyclonatronum proteinivorum]